MPVNVEYQLFPNGDYNWKSTAEGNAPLEIDAKLKAWVSACNAEAGNDSKQITVERDPTHSTGLRTGWVIRLSDGVQPGFMLHFASNTASGFSTNAARCELFPQFGWTDNTSNDGYGGMTGNISADTAIGWYISGAAAEFMVASSTDPGAEFFILSWNMANNAGYRDVVAIFKDTNNNWACEGDDGGARFGIVQNPIRGLQPITAIQAIPLTSHIAKLFFVAGGAYFGGEDSSARLVYPAHPKLWLTAGTAFNFGGYYTALGREFIGISQFDWVVELT